MKKLTKMLLINWHYIDKQIIEFANINFLTGKNGAGKSTIIDAMQLLILGDTRGTFFNKAANDKAGRSLEGYLKGEIGDDGDTGYKYKRNGRFSSYIVCEFYDSVTRKNFLLGIVFDVYKDSDTESHFFSINGKMPESEFVNKDGVPFSYTDLKSFLMREYGNKNVVFYSSNKQYQNEAVQGKLGGLNQKFFNLFKKAVTFTPIDDIEKFIVEYVCDVKNKIDITSMQENIRQYNNLSKQVEIMKTREKELSDIEEIFASYIDQFSKKRELQYLSLRAEKETYIQKLEDLNSGLRNKKEQKNIIETETQKLKNQKESLELEIEGLNGIRARSNVGEKVDNINRKLKEIKEKLDDINKIKRESVNYFRNHSLTWNANILSLEKIKRNIVSDEIQQINQTKDLLKYLEGINEKNFSELEIKALEEIKEKVKKLIELGNNIFYTTSSEKENDIKIKKILEEDINKLQKGINPHDPELIKFKLEIENKLKEKTGKNINVFILADLLEIKNEKWQNAIEGYLNTQKKYLIIEPEFFEEASKIYRELAKNNDKIHSFGIVDVEKIKQEERQALNNSLALEVITKNNFARIYVDYLLGRVIKCETVQELRSNNIAITADCMLYQGYVLRKINPRFYKYPSIGKEALKIQEDIKKKELAELNEKISKEQSIIQIMKDLKGMDNFSEGDIEKFKNNVEKVKNESEYEEENEKLKKELDEIDMLWLNNITKEINEKNNLKKQKEDKISDNNKLYGQLENEIKDIENQKIPEVQERLEEKCKEIDEDYSKEWQEEIGEEKFRKRKLKQDLRKNFGNK